MDSFDALMRCVDLIELDLIGACNSVSVRQLLGLSHLKTLRLCDSDIRDADALTQLPSLHFVDLTACKGMDASASNIASSLRQHGCELVWGLDVSNEMRCLSAMQRRHKF